VSATAFGDQVDRASVSPRVWREWRRRARKRALQELLATLGIPMQVFGRAPRGRVVQLGGYRGPRAPIAFRGELPAGPDLN
jgi:hypothetical protein